MTDRAEHRVEVEDLDTLYRRIPAAPDFKTWDEKEQVYRLNPAALSRKQGEGLSTHLDRIVKELGRAIQKLYPDGYYSVSFFAGVPRCAGGVVDHCDDPDEVDVVRRAAHCEIRPADPSAGKAAWNDIRNEILAVFEWVVVPPVPTDQG